MTNNRDEQIATYIQSLPRDERAYAAAFAHWLIEFHGDDTRATEATIDRAKGIRQSKRNKIRRELVMRGIC